MNSTNVFPGQHVRLTDRFLVEACLDRKRGALFLLLATALPSSGSDQRRVRATGTIQAVRSVLIQVPRIEGQGGNITLARLAPNGAVVRKGDLLAEFDQTNERKLQRDVSAKADDLKHQVEQKAAEHMNNSEKRASDLQQAEADLKKAEIEIRKGPILSDIDQQKNKVKLDDARQHVASLQRSNQSHDLAEKAEIRILELQRDRQTLAVARQYTNLQRLSMHAPIDGMVALENVYRNQSMGHAQEGDQLWGGSSLLRLFDPSEMEVQASVGEPDGIVLTSGAKAVVHLDAFPELTFTAHFVSASPIATSAQGAVKTFSAIFRLDRSDPRLLPDLSAALDIEAPR